MGVFLVFVKIDGLEKRVLKPKVEEGDMVGNPLTADGFKIIIKKQVKNHRGKGGEIVPVEVELEQEKYVKLYVEADKRKIIGNLCAPARGLFFWIMYELDYGKDWLWINKARFMEETGVNSINTYKAAIKELVGRKLLAVSLIKDVFWINPKFFFCGSRINKYKEFVEEYVPKKEKQGE